ncbi:MAG TPA: acyl-CoA dehydrogenase family protein [Beijerinckiaceae bacterium]|nr:acyl-CoA dehydrogenase family protein [Beijerinckiaceae bacterium]HVB90430.1 acyl-CoA dehydrogenase family protein [Beijerinckiaceae bacterium]
MDFAFTEEQEMLRDSVRKLMQRHAPPDLVRRHDRDQTFPYELYDAWVEAGLLRLPFAEDEGGLGGSSLDLAIVVEEIAKVSADFGMAYGGAVFCGLNIARKGAEPQRRFWLERIMNGSAKLAIGISEPGAGSDIGALRTSAHRAGDIWILNGQKLWITGAGLKNCVISVYVRTNRDAHYRNGLSLFLVDNNAPGVDLRKLEMLGRRCVGTYEVFLRDVKVDDDRLIGGENDGWACLMSGLQLERAVSAAGSCGGAQAIVDLASAYAKERNQFGRPIGSFQAIAHMIADMATEVEAARMLTYRACWLVSTGQDALREITMAKLFAGETYAKVANMGVQILGAYGLSGEFDMQRYFRDARSATIAAGTSQTQRNLIARLMGLKSR